MTVMTVRSRFTSYDWKDICDRCRAVVEMPLDGTAAKHLCLIDPVPWKEIQKKRRRTAGVEVAFDGLESYYLDQGRAQRARSVLQDIEPDSPSQMGPFAPGSPPRPRLVGDLLLWSRRDLLSVRGVGRTTVDLIESWLSEHGLTLRKNSSKDLQAFLRANFSARLAALPADQPRSYNLGSYDHPSTSVGRLRHALRLVSDAEALRSRAAVLTSDEDEDEFP